MVEREVVETSAAAKVLHSPGDLKVLCLHVLEDGTNFSGNRVTSLSYIKPKGKNHVTK